MPSDQLISGRRTRSSDLARVAESIHRTLNCRPSSIPTSSQVKVSSRSLSNVGLRWGIVRVEQRMRLIEEAEHRACLGQGRSLGTL